MNANWPTVAIVGAGFGGLNAAKALRDVPVNIVLIDRNNYHLFQPLLYQVSTAGLSPSEIAYPVRTIFRGQPNLKFRMAEVSDIDFEARRLVTSQGAVDYDYLILAAGSATNFFGLETVARNGFDLKSLQDAIDIRDHVLSMMELAAEAQDEHERSALLSFVVVGGGPTGVECSGALSELVRLALRKDFPELELKQAQIILLEAQQRILAGFPEKLSRRAIETLKQKGVDVRLDTALAGYDGRRVTLQDGQSFDACTLVWAAGVRAAALYDRSGLEQGRQGRVLVWNTLQTPAHPEVFVIGDAAYLEADGEPLPMMAPVAIQQGKLAAANIAAQISGEPLQEFRYKDPGSLATIGRNAAVARIGRFEFSGFFAWLVWLAVHLLWLIGFRNRLVVLIDWSREYLWYERSVRLITNPWRRSIERMRQ